ncbi:MAG: AAA family ATPase [Halanaerobiales bacterium]|nr:AAA family ATPase [Halanaerobiales bacterium]
MTKNFNITGVCVSEKHYMVDISKKIAKALQLVESGYYFTINRPRQYGKTTTLSLLTKMLHNRKEYLPLKISFEKIDAPTYNNHVSFIRVFLEIIISRLRFNQEEELVTFIESKIDQLKNMNDLSNLITEFVNKSGRKVVLMIDEVDRSANNQLFLDFLGMLRDKYLLQIEGEDKTFDSVILAGVHDVKNLKLKIRSDDDIHKYNSPWNIAADFKVDMSFSAEEIETMLKSYIQDKNINMDISTISEKLHYYTSGYPFLVSKLCKITDEEILPAKTSEEWNEKDIDQAVKILLREKNTNSETLVKNLENNPDLYRVVYDIIMDGKQITYNIHNPILDIGTIYGIFRNHDGLVRIHNRIYEQLIYDYMSSKIETSISMDNYNFRGQFICEDYTVNFKKVLLKFQEFMKEQYSKNDEVFLERNGRLLFLAFIKPIINGKGFDFKEVQISEEKRLDIVITYLKYRYIVELKVWRGEKAHEKGLLQLVDYLERTNEDKGYLIVYDFRKGTQKEWKNERTIVKGKEIFVVWV